ncbi:MAG: PhoH family protein [Methylocystaceae bacterium]|nr:PhoH family protein [Methylocystaceae bacterium]
MAKHREKRRHREEAASTIIPLNRSKKAKFSEERNPPPIIAKTHRQAVYLGHLRTAEQIFVLGPAGTGKTWLAATYAADLYRKGTIQKIILTRPNVSCGRSLGFFPGSLERKFAPWAVPVTDAISDRLGKAVFDVAMKNGDIEIVPFEVMRGRSWKDAFVLLDEAQNASIAEIKMFLTRIGENCLTVINGDIAQCDLAAESGLRLALNLIERNSLPVPIVEFEIDDIVRSGLCAMWVRAFSSLAAE